MEKERCKSLSKFALKDAFVIEVVRAVSPKTNSLIFAKMTQISVKKFNNYFNTSGSGTSWLLPLSTWEL